MNMISSPSRRSALAAGRTTCVGAWAAAVATTGRAPGERGMTSSVPGLRRRALTPGFISSIPWAGTP